MVNESLLARKTSARGDQFDDRHARRRSDSSAAGLAGRRAPAVSPANRVLPNGNKENDHLVGLPPLQSRLPTAHISPQQPRWPSPNQAAGEKPFTLPMAHKLARPPAASLQTTAPEIPVSASPGSVDGPGGVGVGVGDNVEGIMFIPNLSAGRRDSSGGAKPDVSLVGVGRVKGGVPRKAAMLYDDEEEALMDELLSYDGARTPRQVNSTGTALSAASNGAPEGGITTEAQCVETALVSQDDAEIGRTSQQQHSPVVDVDYERELGERMQRCLTSGLVELESPSTYPVLKRHNSAPSLTPTSSRKFLTMVSSLIKRRRNGKVKPS